VAATVPEVEDAELLQPRRLYERQGRMDEYAAFVDRLKGERVETLRKYPELSEEIVRAVG
jgi:phosphoenolpyruvate carboxykinase (ATP)